MELKQYEGQQFSSKMSEKGQTTIPQAIREMLELQPGDRMTYIVKDCHIEVINSDSALMQKARDALAASGTKYNEDDFQRIFAAIKKVPR